MGCTQPPDIWFVFLYNSIYLCFAIFQFCPKKAKSCEIKEDAGDAMGWTLPPDALNRLWSVFVCLQHFQSFASFYVQVFHMTGSNFFVWLVICDLRCVFSQHKMMMSNCFSLCWVFSLPKMVMSNCISLGWLALASSWIGRCQGKLGLVCRFQLESNHCQLLTKWELAWSLITHVQQLFLPS